MDWTSLTIPDVIVAAATVATAWVAWRAVVVSRAANRMAKESHLAARQARRLDAGRYGLEVLTSGAAGDAVRRIERVAYSSYKSPDRMVDSEVLEDDLRIVLVSIRRSGAFVISEHMDDEEPNEYEAALVDEFFRISRMLYFIHSRVLSEMRRLPDQPTEARYRDKDFHGDPWETVFEWDSLAWENVHRISGAYFDACFADQSSRYLDEANRVIVEADRKLSRRDDALKNPPLPGPHLRPAEHGLGR